MSTGTASQPLTVEKVENSNALYFLVGILVVLLFCYAMFRGSLNEIISS